MTHIRAKSLLCKAGEEHILRRIGAALVVHWDGLPDALKNCVIDQAVLMEDSSPLEPARTDVETFVRAVKVRNFNRVATV